MHPQVGGLTPVPDEAGVPILGRERVPGVRCQEGARSTVPGVRCQEGARRAWVVPGVRSSSAKSVKDLWVSL